MQPQRRCLPDEPVNTLGRHSSLFPSIFYTIGVKQGLLFDVPHLSNARFTARCHYATVEL